MDQSKMLKAAVIGVGYLGRFHAQKYAALDGVELMGVIDLDPAQAKQVGEELGVPWFTDYRDLLGALDLVTIATPTIAHYRVTEACLKAGIHVLVEKPVTATLAEADELIQLADRKKLVFQVGHLKRFHPAVLALKKSGLLKKTRFIESQRIAPFKPRALDVDVVLDLMIHDVDLILNFVGADVVDIQAMGAPIVTHKVDIANARLKFANGCVANVTASRVAAAATRNIRLFQDESFLTLDFIDKSIRVVQRSGATEMVEGTEVFELKESTLPIEDHDTLEAEIASFCDVVRGGGKPLVSGRDGRKALEVVTAIRETIDDFSRRLKFGVPSSE
ncbi:MAG: Gfo/Idh/MocA family oxidoreductase [Magnetococcales bacterium]|nr:Gfo/Idh/MocA family oxidoreductase [Magnetococcales bacterium]